TRLRRGQWTSPPQRSPRNRVSMLQWSPLQSILSPHLQPHRNDQYDRNGLFWRDSSEMSLRWVLQRQHPLRSQRGSNPLTTSSRFWVKDWRTLDTLTKSLRCCGPTPNRSTVETAEKRKQLLSALAGKSIWSWKKLEVLNCSIFCRI